MPETPDLYAEVAALRIEVEDMSAMTEALLRGGNASIADELITYLSRDESARLVFLLADGVRTQAEIAAEISARGVRGGSQPTVSRKLEQLAHDHHLLLLDRRQGRSNVYRKSKVSAALHIERKLKAAGLGL